MRYVQVCEWLEKHHCYRKKASQTEKERRTWIDASNQNLDYGDLSINLPEISNN
jgi:hypothetical protein